MNLSNGVCVNCTKQNMVAKDDIKIKYMEHASTQNKARALAHPVTLI